MANGSKIRTLLFSGDDWQIFDTAASVNVLLARPELGRKWCSVGLLSETAFTETAFGDSSFWLLESDARYALSPVEGGRSPDSRIDALAFAHALRESRRIDAHVSFGDSIYVERFSRLLPTWTLTPHVEDEMVLGIWITGGVRISANSFRRLCHLAGWMSPSELAEIVSVAGLGVPCHIRQSAINTPVERNQQDVGLSPCADEVVASGQGHLSDGKKHPRTFELPGRPQLEQFFNDHVVDIVFNAEKYKPFGIDFPSAIVLFGPSGCGKTFAVEKLADFLDWPLYPINAESVGSPFIHETSRRISEVFDKAIDGAPSVIVIDEMESFLSDRRVSGPSSLHHFEEVAEFLRRVPEATKRRTLVVAMTNMIDLIDPAILRRGRFSHVIEVGFPTRPEVSSLLASLLEKLPVADDLQLDSVIGTLAGRPISDVSFVVQEAARLAAKAGKSELNQESIAAALAGVPRDTEKATRPIGFTRGS